MSFALSEEQRLLKDAARDFCRERAPVKRLRDLRDARQNGRDPELWAEMAQLGWAGVLVPEEHGGAGLGHVGMGLVLEETGRTLAASPLLSTAMIGASALNLGGDERQKSAWLARLAAGEVVVALAVDEGPHHAPGRSAMAFAGGRLSGRKVYVADGHLADVLIVIAADAVFLVRADAEGVARTELTTVDSRGAADISFDAAAAEPLIGGAALAEQILDIARIGLAAEMLGHAQEAFEITGEYLKTRKQFGQVIGGFQALQHRAAKMFVELELTRSCVYGALAALDAGEENIAEWASLAKARAGDTLHLISNELVQMHGGIGMTDAHDAGFYLKRARVAEGLYGSAAFHRDRYARLMAF